MNTTSNTAKSLLLFGALGITALLSACQTAPPASPANAVTCDKCKMVWVEHSYNTGYAKHPGVYIPVKSKVMQCPDCESAVVTFFKTGQLKHHCSHCGGTLTHCTYH
jgi:ribosomal protein S27E